MDYKKAWKYIKKYGPYIVAVSTLIKIGILYGGKVATTGDWNPFRFNRERETEQIDEKKSKLEEKSLDCSKINYPYEAKDL